MISTYHKYNMPPQDGWATLSVYASPIYTIQLLARCLWIWCHHAGPTRVAYHKWNWVFHGRWARRTFRFIFDKVIATFQCKLWLVHKIAIHFGAVMQHNFSNVYSLTWISMEGWVNNMIGITGELLLYSLGMCFTSSRNGVVGRDLPSGV